MNTPPLAKASLSLALGVACCLLLSSCDPVNSIKPLASPDTAQADPQLVGTWLVKKDPDQTTIRFSIVKGPWMRAEISPGKRKKNGEPESYDFYPVVIGKNHFLNVIMSEKDDQGRNVKRYVFLRYEISFNHRLQMWLMDEDEIEDAIDDGKLKGVVHEDNDIMIGTHARPDADVTLQDSSAHISTFIQNADMDDLFPDKLNTLYRVK
jgi:hypothetical protein